MVIVWAEPFMVMVLIELSAVTVFVNSWVDKEVIIHIDRPVDKIETLSNCMVVYVTVKFHSLL